MSKNDYNQNSQNSEKQNQQNKSENSSSNSQKNQNQSKNSSSDCHNGSNSSKENNSYSTIAERAGKQRIYPPFPAFYVGQRSFDSFPDSPPSPPSSGSASAAANGLPSPPGVFLPCRGGSGCVFCSSLKNGVFLNVPFCRDSANAAKLLAGKV